jgi:hypothetical protein
MLPTLIGMSAKALLPSTKKIDKNKILNEKKSSAIQKVDSEREIVKQPVIKKKSISSDLFLPSVKPAGLLAPGKEQSGKNLKETFSKISDTLKGIIDALKNKDTTTKVDEKNKKKVERSEELKDREKKLETKKRKQLELRPKLPGDKFNIMKFFENILIGSIVLAIFKNLEKIVEFFKGLYDQFKNFVTKLGEVLSPIWNGLKWIASGGANIIAKIMGIPSQEADTNGLKKNLEEITKKIPVIGDLFKGIQSVIDSIRGYKEPTEGGGATTTSSGDLFEIISGGEGGVNSVNRGVAGDTPGGARSIFGKDLTDMTVDQIYAAQRAGKVSAVGKYQIIKITMPGFIKYLKGRGIDTSRTKFTEEIQDMFRTYVVDFKRPEVGRYIRGESSNRAEAVQELAREFASIGLAYDEAGRGKGESRYSGTAGNRASISPETVAAALDRARSGGLPLSQRSQRQQQADVAAQQAATQVTPTPQITPTSIQVTPTPEITPAQIAPMTAPSMSAEIPQIMQQAEYEVFGQSNSSTIIPIPIGGTNQSKSMPGGTTILPVGMDKKQALNSYYQSQLIGFLYKQG